MSGGFGPCFSWFIRVLFEDIRRISFGPANPLTPTARPPATKAVLGSRVFC